MSAEALIQIDSREQCPLEIQSHPTEIATLSVGDYGIRGFSDWDNPAFVVERKSLSDLIGSLTQGRPRFMREVEKMRQFRFAAILIEAYEAEVERHDYQSKATPKSIIQSLAAIQVRVGVHVVWAGDRDGAARALEGFVRQFVRGIEKDLRRLQRATAGVAP